MKNLNYEKLMALKPTEYGQIVNALGQIVTFVEHPIAGDEYPVITVFKDLEMAFATDFYDTDDMMASHGEYTPAFMHGECKPQWEFDLSGNKEVFVLENFIFNLQELSPKDAIREISMSNLTDEEIVKCIKTIASSETFKFIKS